LILLEKYDSCCRNSEAPYLVYIKSNQAQDNKAGCTMETSTGLLILQNIFNAFMFTRPENQRQDLLNWWNIAVSVINDPTTKKEKQDYVKLQKLTKNLLQFILQKRVPSISDWQYLQAQSVLTKLYSDKRKKKAILFTSNIN
jgi:hypothetical protein